MPSLQIGFIGLGTMGMPMAMNLRDAGYHVVGYDHDDGQLATFRTRGAVVDSARAVSKRTDVIITCLPDTEAVSEAMHAEDGIIAGLNDEQTVIDMSTISPTVTAELGAELSSRGVEMLDAPMSGGESGAKTGSLMIMVGGDRAVLGEFEPILEVLGERIVHCGPIGAGQVTKACNQIVVANTMQAVSEALVFASQAGADLEAVVEALRGGAAGCWTLDHRAERMINGQFDPGFFATYQYKDLRIATNAGDAVGAPMPITNITKELYKSMVATDLAYEDNSGILQINERLAGTEARVPRTETS